MRRFLLVFGPKPYQSPSEEASLLFMPTRPPPWCLHRSTTLRPQFNPGSEPLHPHPPPRRTRRLWECRAQRCLKFPSLMESSELFINLIMAGDEIFSLYVPVSRCLLICFTSRPTLTLGPEEPHARLTCIGRDSTLKTPFCLGGHLKVIRNKLFLHFR